MGPSFAFICTTPLQVFNVVDFVMNDVMGSKDRSDIYINVNIRNSREIAKRVSELKAFRTVYLLGLASVKHRLYRLYAASYLFFPRSTMKRCVVPAPSLDRQYSYVFASSTTIDLLCIKRAFRAERFLGFDDGLGSYSENVFLDHESPRVRVVDVLFFGGKLQQSPEKLYLYRPDLYNGTVNCEIELLPKISVDVQKALKYVFQYQDNELYRTHRTVYLSQPLNLQERRLFDREQEVLRLLQEADKDLLVRIHPRHSAENYSGCSIDTVNNMWELECVEQITDENILISAGSTAQVFPKLLFDKEPSLIFLYELLLDKEKATDYTSMRNAAEKIKRLYRDPERVFIPQTMGEYKEALTCIFNYIF